MSTEDAIVIIGAARRPMGGFLGDFKDVAAPALGARVISAAVERAGVSPESVDEVLMGASCRLGRARRRRARPLSARACRSPRDAPRSTRCAARA